MRSTYDWDWVEGFEFKSSSVQTEIILKLIIDTFKFNKSFKIFKKNIESIINCLELFKYIWKLKNLIRQLSCKVKETKLGWITFP